MQRGLAKGGVIVTIADGDGKRWGNSVRVDAPADFDPGVQ